MKLEPPPLSTTFSSCKRSAETGRSGAPLGMLRTEDGGRRTAQVHREQEAATNHVCDPERRAIASAGARSRRPRGTVTTDRRDLGTGPRRSAEEVDLRALVNATRAAAVAVDAGGRVVAANAAWTTASTGGQLAPGPVLNFLDVCQRTAGTSASYAASSVHRAAEGVRAVLAGRQREYSLEYEGPPHEPDARYVLRAVAAGSGALISVEPTRPRPGPLPSPEMAGDLQRALDGDEIEVWFQPVVDLSTGHVAELEALVRWRHPRLGMLLPDRFLPEAAQAGLLQLLCAKTLRAACEQAARLLDERPEERIRVAVNISAPELRDPTLAWLVREALAAGNLPPAALRLEVSEPVLMQDVVLSTRVLRTLRGCGVRLAVDDFGTGASSLPSLKRLPVDLVKVDRSFISGLGTDPEDTVVVAAITDLVHALGFGLAAVGVETEEQLAHLAAMGCDLAQGFYFAPPAPANRMTIVAYRPAASGGFTVDRASASEEPAVDALRYVAHELSNRLTVIDGLAVLARETAEEAERDHVLDNLTTQADLAKKVIETMWDLQAADAGTISIAPEHVDLREIVDRAVDAVTSPRSRDTIAVDVASIDVSCDPVKLGQVVTNLLSNALHHTPTGSHVRVSAELVEDAVRLHVIDDGPGIPPDKVATAFRKFGRIDRAIPGSGIGLYIGRSIVRAHGGDLTYRDAPGGGADFVVELPRPNGGTTPGARR